MSIDDRDGRVSSMDVRIYAIVAMSCTGFVE